MDNFFISALCVLGHSDFYFHFLIYGIATRADNEIITSEKRDNNDEVEKM